MTAVGALGHAVMTTGTLTPPRLRQCRQRQVVPFDGSCLGCFSFHTECCYGIKVKHKRGVSRTLLENGGNLDSQRPIQTHRRRTVSCMLELNIGFGFGRNSAIKHVIAPMFIHSRRIIVFP